MQGRASTNSLNGKVSGSSLISTPGPGGANAAGFATVNDLLNEANAERGLHGLTTSGSPFGAYQTALRDVSRAQPASASTTMRHFDTRTSKGMRRVIAAWRA